VQIWSWRQIPHFDPLPVNVAVPPRLMCRGHADHFNVPPRWRRLAVLHQRAIARQLARQHVEDRRHEDAEEGDADHAGEHRDTHRGAHFRARTR
jgi:hypothetical protein